MDLALHPNFATNRHVYLTYTKPLDATKRATTMQPLIVFATSFDKEGKALETKPFRVAEGMNPKSKAVPADVDDSRRHAA
jgi:hypothetical protein